MDISWSSEYAIILFVWRFFLFGAVWFWVVPRILRIPFPNGPSANPKAYQKEERGLKALMFAWYIFIEILVLSL